MRMREVVIDAERERKLREHLLARPDQEQLAFLMVELVDADDRVRLIVRDVVLVADDGFDIHGGAALQPRMAACVLPLVEQCSREGLGLIEAHSHPFDTGGGTSFSDTDTGNMWGKYPFLNGVLGGAPVGALVFGQNAIDGLYWIPKEDCLAPIHRISVIDHPLHYRFTTFVRRHASIAEPLPETDTLARQILAFGKEGQAVLSSLRVAIVGLGGLGSVLLDPLVRAGVSDFVLVDPDTIDAEGTNLNRVAGSTQKDASKETSKVEIGRRVLRTITDRPMRVAELKNSVGDDIARQALKGADVIFGAVDSDGARVIMNRLATEFMIPYIDSGVGIETDDDGQITNMGGQVRVVLPGRPCLLCQDAIDLNRAELDLTTPEARERRERRGYISGFDLPAPSVMALNMQVASAAVLELFALVTDYKPYMPLTVFNMKQGYSMGVSVERRADCVACGDRPFADSSVKGTEPVIGSGRVPLAAASVAAEA